MSTGALYLVTARQCFASPVAVQQHSLCSSYCSSRQLLIAPSELDSFPYMSIESQNGLSLRILPSFEVDEHGKKSVVGKGSCVCIFTCFVCGHNVVS